MVQVIFIVGQSRGHTVAVLGLDELLLMDVSNI